MPVEILRTRVLPLSETKRFPFESIAPKYGVFNVAVVAVWPSPRLTFVAPPV